LTLDENLQLIAETELEAAAREIHAKSGIAILVRPGTGELLAMASFPGFNPNRFGDYPASRWRNRSITDVYAPGSTFKVVGAAAALQEGVTTEDERIDCGGGSLRVGESVIRDSRYFDVLTFREVVEKSSNVGMIRIGQRLGKERLEKYIHAFGFGEPSGIELPAESRGLLRSSDHWGPVTLASISFGQEIGVTPLQMVDAANVIASSGYLMKPRLLLGFGGPNGVLEKTVSPEPVRRVLSEETTRRITALLVGVVERGTGKRARIPGYRVAGKTGTAQKAVRGGYSTTDFIASFIGFAPVEQPELTALVILDSPEGDHSGGRAAAVFARIVERSLQYLGVPRSDEPALSVAKVWPQIGPIMGHGVEPARRRARKPGSYRQSVRAMSPMSEGEGTPDVVGLPARDALVRFVASGIVPEIVGSGWVVGQYPLARAPVEPGVKARLLLGAVPTAPPQGVPELQLREEIVVAAIGSSRSSKPKRAERWPGPTE